MNGLINLYKPSGMSSAHAVGIVRRALGEKAVGHMGTLDPMAQGVLVLGVGKSTRLFDYLTNKRKTYIAKFTFGYQTDTLDALGAVTDTTNDIPSIDAIGHAMDSLIGEIDQLPPVYSAKHVNGKRAYKLARSGGKTAEEVELKPAKVTIYGAELISQPAMNEAVFCIECSAGTYIRSIARDVAKMCGSLATLTFLERTRSGYFKVEDSVSIETLETVKSSALIPPQSVLDLPRLDVETEYYDDLFHGRRIECDIRGDALIYCRDEFFGIGRTECGALKIKTYLKDS